MEIVLLTALTALGWKIIDLLKFLRAGDVNAAVTQVVTWAAGVGVVFLGSATDWAETFAVNGITLESLNGASKVLVGASLLSLGSVGFDFKKALDGSDSARTPSLISETPHHPAP